MGGRGRLVRETIHSFALVVLAYGRKRKAGERNHSQFCLGGLGVLVPGHRPHVNLIRAVSQPQHSGPGIHLSHGEVVMQSCPSMCLKT